jgi:tetratricopeptide (TPR) repeat protein
MANEYYISLEITSNASAEDVKRAYFTMVRKYPPEQYPQKFKVIQEAYNTLRDRGARQDYDILQKHGGEIERLLEEVKQAGDKEDHARAVQLLKRVLIIHPENTGAMARLGEALIKANEPVEGVRVYQKLLELSINSSEYHVRASFACIDAYKATKESSYLAKVRDFCERALELEPINSMAHVAIALSYYVADDNINALPEFDKAIMADDKVDYQDVDAFEFKMLICMEDANTSALATLSRQIKENISDPELRNFIVVKLFLVCKPYYEGFLKDEHGGLGIKITYIRFMRDAMKLFCDIGSGKVWSVSNSILQQLDIAIQKHKLFEILMRQKERETQPTQSTSSGGSGCMVIVAVAASILAAAAACVIAILNLLL